MPSAKERLSSVNSKPLAVVMPPSLTEQCHRKFITKNVGNEHEGGDQETNSPKESKLLPLIQHSLKKSEGNMMLSQKVVEEFDITVANIFDHLDVNCDQTLNFCANEDDDKELNELKRLFKQHCLEYSGLETEDID